MATLYNDRISVAVCCDRTFTCFDLGNRNGIKR